MYQNTQYNDISTSNGTKRRILTQIEGNVKKKQKTRENQEEIIRIVTNAQIQK